MNQSVCGGISLANWFNLYCVRALSCQIFILRRWRGKCLRKQCKQASLFFISLFIVLSLFTCAMGEERLVIKKWFRGYRFQCVR